MQFPQKVTGLVLFSLFFALLMACQTEDTMKKVVGITWIHSFEDDKDGTEAYRPESYEFPPARGREGWKFEEDGMLTKQAIAPTDGYITKEGKWTFASENKPNIITITLENEIQKYELISVSDSILFVKSVE